MVDSTDEQRRNDGRRPGMSCETVTVAGGESQRVAEVGTMMPQCDDHGEAVREPILNTYALSRTYVTTKFLLHCTNAKEAGLRGRLAFYTHP